MGDPRRLVRKYELPRHPWEKARIEEENKLARDYGLKNKQEIWRAKASARKYRHVARALVGLSEKEREEKSSSLMSKLVRIGLLKQGATLDDVLSIGVSDVLERRLQTQVWKRGLAKSVDQARQFISHGHIALRGKRVTSPGMAIPAGYEEQLGWYSQPIVTLESKKQHAESSLEAAKAMPAALTATAPATEAQETPADAATAEEETDTIPPIVADEATEKPEKKDRKKLPN